MFARTANLFVRPCWRDDLMTLARSLVTPELGCPVWPPVPDDGQGPSVHGKHCFSTSLLVFERSPDQPRLVGGIGFQNDDGAVELGCWTTGRRDDAWPLQDALRQVIGALGGQKLVSGHFRDNARSAHLLRSLGFRPTGRIVVREDRLHRSRRRPYELFAFDDVKASHRPAAAALMPNASVFQPTRDTRAPALQ